MSQQVTDLALALKDLLFDNWALTDNLDRLKIKWHPYEPTRTELTQEPISISVVYQSGSGETECKALDQIKDVIKVDIWYSLQSLPSDEDRAKSERNRILLKDQIIRLIKSNQTALSGVRFSRTIRSARSDEVDSDDEGWYLHETLFIQAEWYLTS